MSIELFCAVVVWPKWGTDQPALSSIKCFMMILWSNSSLYTGTVLKQINTCARQQKAARMHSFFSNHPVDQWPYCHLPDLAWTCRHSSGSWLGSIVWTHTVDLPLGPCGAANCDPSSSSRIEPVQCNGALPSTKASYLISYLICTHKPVTGGGQIKWGAEKRGNMNSALHASVNAWSIVALMLLTPAGYETCIAPTHLIK